MTELSSLDGHQLADFWAMPPVQRESILLEAIAESHAWHYQRNQAYRHTVAARGVGTTVGPSDLDRLLRPTAQTFKSYIEILGTPFPQELLVKTGAGEGDTVRRQYQVRVFQERRRRRYQGQLYRPVPEPRSLRFFRRSRGRFELRDG